MLASTKLLSLLQTIMAATSFVSLSFYFCIFLLCHGSMAQLFGMSSNPWQSCRQGGFRECTFNRLQASTPLRQVRSHAGLTEYFDDQNEQFRCIGVSVIRRVIEPRGYLLPRYHNTHGLVYIIQGSGFTGLSFPGCPATFQKQFQKYGQAQSVQGQSQSQKFKDEHQKVQHVRQGDVIALPAGITHWLYNDGDAPIVAIYVFDVNNNANQLEPRHKEFLLAGNYRSSQLHSSQNIFSGFDVRLLRESLGISGKIAQRLQSKDDEIGDIIHVNHTLKFLKPIFTQQQEQESCPYTEYEEGQSQARHPQEEQPQMGQPQAKHYHGEQPQTGQSQAKHSQGEQTQTGQSQAKHLHGGQPEEGRGGQSQEEQSEAGPYPGCRPHAGQSHASESTYGGWNGLEENFCDHKLTANIDDPSRAEIYNPRAGTITHLNSQTFPILNIVQMSATRVHLYQNAIISPLWNINAHSVMYMIQGHILVQVVNDHGRNVFNGLLSPGQLLIIPQNYVVLKKAQRDGSKYIEFKTNANSMVSHIAGKNSILGALPVDVIASAYDISRTEARSLKFNREEELGVFAPKFSLSFPKGEEESS
uniref:Cupin type-1 domain-containing protein n=2 Tax=Hordeum vulgare subsp. vulgare TaxID=112509 RepID=A0A8I6WH70_HORVV